MTLRTSTAAVSGELVAVCGSTDPWDRFLHNETVELVIGSHHNCQYGIGQASRACRTRIAGQKAYTLRECT